MRAPTDDADLYRRFVVRTLHKVSNDHVIKAAGRLWEAPRRSARSWVEVARHPFEPQAQVGAALADAMQERMSAALIAPAGTGKTVALRMLVAALPEVRFAVHYVKVTGLSKRDLCKEIAVACGLSPTGIYPALVRKLQDAFAHTAGDGMRPVILLDEAHDLRPESLAMLRVLTNFEMDSRLVVSLVLAGQPHLRVLLRRPEQAAIAHRLAHYAELRLLSRDETAAYVEHRCTLAGARSNPFDGDAQQTIFEMSRGNLRAIDRLALAALQRAAKSSHSTVSSGDVIAARKSLWP